VQTLAVSFLMEIDDKLMALFCNLGWKVRRLKFGQQIRPKIEGGLFYGGSALT
jgi:hypothetical protein